MIGSVGFRSLVEREIIRFTSMFKMTIFPPIVTSFLYISIFGFTIGKRIPEISGIPYSLTIHGPYIFRAPERWALGEKIIRSAFTVAITDFTKSQCMMYIPFEHWGKLRVVRCGQHGSLTRSLQM